MKSIIRYALLSACLGILITISTVLVKRDNSYDVSLCVRDGNTILSVKTVGSITVHYKSAGLPWTFKDFEPQSPYTSTCPETQVATYKSSFTTNNAKFIYDFFVWFAVSLSLVYINHIRINKNIGKKK
jgi:hypothetical protein